MQLKKKPGPPGKRKNGGGKVESSRSPMLTLFQERGGVPGKNNTPLERRKQCNLGVGRELEENTKLRFQTVLGWKTAPTGKKKPPPFDVQGKKKGTPEWLRPAKEVGNPARERSVASERVE